MSPPLDPGFDDKEQMSPIQKAGIAHIIQGACAFDDRPESIALIQMALALGAHPTLCAGACAFAGSSSLLGYSMRAGADPNAILEALDFTKNVGILPLIGSSCTIARLAMAGCDPDCCSLLAQSGADPYAVQPDKPKDMAASPFQSHSISDNMIRCAIELLACAAPHPEAARSLASQWAPALADSHGVDRSLGFELLARLDALGADLDETHKPFAGTHPLLHFSERYLSRLLRSRSPGDASACLAMVQLTNFFTQRSPVIATGAFIGMITAYADTGQRIGSRLPASNDEAQLRISMLRLAERLGGSESTALSLLDFARRDMDSAPDHRHSKSAKDRSLRGFHLAAKPFEFLRQAAESWESFSPSDPSSINPSIDAMSELLCMSALANQSLMTSTQFTEWATHPSADAPVGIHASSFWMACCKIAASSHPALARGFLAICPCASELVNAQSSREAMEALFDKALLAGHQAAREAMGPPSKKSARL